MSSDRNIINKKITALVTAVDKMLETKDVTGFKYVSSYKIHTPKQLQEQLKKLIKLETHLNESFSSKMNIQMIKESLKKLYEGYKILPPIDKERYTKIDGLDGPFRTLSGNVLYYDTKQDAYYDRDTDMYISHDEFRQMDNDYSVMKDERDEVKENAGYEFMDDLDWDFSNLRRMDWGAYENDELEEIIDYMYHMDLDDQQNSTYDGSWAKAARYVEKKLKSRTQDMKETEYRLPADAAGFRTGTKFRRGGLASGPVDKKTYDQEMAAFKQSQTAPKPKAPKMINGPRVAESVRGLGSIDWPDTD